MGPARFLNGLNITGDLTVTGNILPGANNTYDIGSTSLTWKAGYFKKLSINGADMASSTYVLDVGGTSHFESNAQFDANITVDGISNLKGNTIIGTTTSGSNKTLTVNGHVIINPSYNTNNSYSEGLRINKDSNNWSVIALGGGIGTETGTSSAVWLIGANGSNNFYISNSGSDSSANRFQGTPTTGFRMYASASTSALQTGTLTLGSTTSTYNGSGAGGDVALEFWRGTNASWQIINHGGVLQFKNNYSNAAQSTYNQFALDLGYGGNDSMIYTHFKPYTGSSTATQSTLTLGLSTANWDTIFTKTLKFAYDSTDQYLTHAGVAELASHSGKITLYRLLASGTAGSATSGNNLRPGVLLDAATGLISLEAPNSAPSATAGARIKFDFYDSSSSNNQPVFISHVVSDSYRPPYGLTVWGSVGTKPYAWLEVEGSMYVGARNDISSLTDVAQKRLCASLYIGYKKNGNVFISKAAVSGYDDWLRLNDLIDFTNGVYTPHELRSGNSLSIAADTLVSSTNRADATFYTGYDTSTATVTYINTTKNIIAHRTSIGMEDATTDDNLLYVDAWSKFRGDLRPDATNTYSLGTSTRRWKTLFIGTADTYGSGIIPIYWNSGVPTPSTSTVGSGVIPIYLNAGTLTASTSTVGSGIKPIYLNAGTLTVSNSTVGSGVKPIYLTSGTLTASTTTVGAGDQPIYLSSGTLTASTSTIGSTTKGVYLSSGFIKAMTYELKATVNSSTTNYLAYYSGANAISGKTGSGAIYTTSSGGAITFGTLPIAQGGTGQTTAQNAINALLNGLPTWTATPTDSTYFIRQDTAGSATYGKVTFSTLWDYISSKLSTSTINANVYEENLLWGQTNKVGEFGVIDQVMSHRGRGNRFAGIPAAAVTIQYSTDGGSTWTTNASTDANKRALFTTGTSYRLVPSGNVTNNSQLRIIVDTGAGSIYTVLKKFMIYVSTSYSNGCKVTIDAALQSAPDNYTLNICTNQPISGWSGWNVINCNFTTYGNTTTSQYGRIRFTFKHDSITSGRESSGLVVNSIYGYGGVGWTTPSTFALTDHIYSWDYALNATFPANVTASKVYGAVWNDYAEYRQTKENIKPGKVVIETGNGDLKLSDRRLQPGANVTTDTFGFAIGETKTHKTPIAVSGRVLAYPYESLDEFRKHIGSPVCSGPDGTVSIMSINEERLYPSRIIGTVSEIPDYEEWGTENIKVNGRIWIRIR